MKLGTVADSLVKLSQLQGRQVRINFRTGSKTTGKLTKIEYKEVDICFPGQSASKLVIPYSIELDHETEYTHYFESLEKIEPV